MRIDAYSQISQIYAANKPKQIDRANPVAGVKDEFKMSSAGRDMQIAKQAVAEASDIREDKVADIKQRMDSGSYRVDTGDFASMLLEKYNAGF